MAWLVRDNEDEPFRIEAAEPEACWCKMQVSDEVVAAAEACYAESEQLDTYGIVATISKFLLAERQKIASDLFNRYGFMVLTEKQVTISFSSSEEARSFHSALVDISTYRDKSEDRTFEEISARKAGGE
ncbi:hypothetical protein DEM27_10245 [Metarhizobium album]|uniref:Uncharacterized protein n=1 Tax=Metarhizobium album TaxID=2182425 RepID=A0A2U2DTV3_9HYPH|nr:hypothetical protein [Rhizobium album]PWE56734.1 hypothetical protein DEM27_10245 [Rhizobium album]